MRNKQAHYRIGHAGYVSEFDEFLDGYLHDHPDVERDQKCGWYILWDRNVDFDLLEEEEKATVKAKAYAYD